MREPLAREARALALVIVLLLVGLTWLLYGCASNPVALAQTPLQKAYALYGEFVIVEEQAAALKSAGTLTGKTLLAIQQADARVKPVADSLLVAIREVNSTAATDSPALEQTLTLASESITAFATTVKQAQAP